MSSSRQPCKLNGGSLSAQRTRLQLAGWVAGFSAADVLHIICGWHFGFAVGAKIIRLAIIDVEPTEVENHAMDTQWAGQGDLQLESGRACFLRAIRGLMKRNGLTNRRFYELSKWANPWFDDGGMSPTMISYIQGGNTKTLGPRAIRSLGQINLRLAERAGASSPDVDALPRIGMLPSRLELPEPEACWYLRHPETGLPLNSGGLYQVRTGELIPEGLEDDAISDTQAAALSSALARLAQRWLIDQGILPSEGIGRVLSFYPVEDAGRRRRLQLVMAGLEAYNGEELTMEVPAIGALIGGLTGEPPARSSTDLAQRLNRA